MNLLEENLLTSFSIDGADGFIRTAESDALAIGRPRGAENVVARNRDGDEQFVFGDIPDLHFARPPGAPAGDCQLHAIGREAYRVDAFAHADEARDGPT